MGRKAPKVGVVIAAGGRGRRLGGRLPKQFHLLGRTPILVRTLNIFAGMREVGPIVVVVPRGYLERAKRLIARAGFRKVAAVVTGGSERQKSVRAGLEAFSPAPDVVLVHDAVRPFVRRRIVRTVIRKAVRCGAAVVGMKITDTIKEGSRGGYFVRTLPREDLWAVQTPQGFRFSLLLRAHRRAEREGFLGTDESSLVERLGHRVCIVIGERGNIKITSREDLKTARMRVEGVLSA